VSTTRSIGRIRNEKSTQNRFGECDRDTTIMRGSDRDPTIASGSDRVPTFTRGSDRDPFTIRCESS
jgi:hypothetical protein